MVEIRVTGSQEEAAGAMREVRKAVVGWFTKERAKRSLLGSGQSLRLASKTNTEMLPCGRAQVWSRVWLECLSKGHRG